MKKSLIIGIAILIVIIGAVYVVVDVINKKIEDVIVEILDEETGNYQRSYREVSISVPRGSLTISGLELTEDNLSVEIESIEFQLPLGDAVGIAMDSDNGQITDVRVRVNGMKVFDHLKSFQIEQDDLLFHFKGHINAKVFHSDYMPNKRDFIIESIEMDNSEVNLITELGRMSFTDLSFVINGDIDVSNFESEFNSIGYLALKDSLADLYVHIEGFKYEPELQIQQTLTMMAFMFLGDVSLLRNEENWAIDKLSLNASIEDDTVSMNHLDLITNWIDLHINASLTIDETIESFAPLDININFNSYVNELRPVLEMFTSQITDEKIPEGSFSLTLSQENTGSYPNVKVEKIN